jgi:tetratricopeptide (TPR) repeat protein
MALTILSDDLYPRLGGWFGAGHRRGKSAAHSGRGGPRSCGMFLHMASERVEHLKSILAQDPRNTFARYALGMEYMAAGETDSALQEFRVVLEVDANYANAFFMGAQALEEAERIAEAVQWLREGIVCAQRAGNKHAETEMQSMLEELED